MRKTIFTILKHYQEGGIECLKQLGYQGQKGKKSNYGCLNARIKYNKCNHTF